MNAVSLHADFQTIRMEIRSLRTDLGRAMWRMFLTALSLQVVVVSVLVAVLIEMLGTR